MTAPLPFFKIPLLLLACSFIIACHSDGNKKKETPEINTFNIFTFENSIYSFNEETGSSTKRGEFDEGEAQFIELNTDEDKQGYEFAVYVLDNKIFLLNYDKSAERRTIELLEIDPSQTICGLISQKTASVQSFLDDTASNRSELDLPIISIEYQQSGLDCDSNTNSRDMLDFSSVIEDPENTRDIIRSSGQSAHILGGLIIDYTSVSSVTQNAVAGSSGFLGQDLSGNRLVFNYKIKDVEDQWSSSFMPSTGSQFIKQVSNDQVLVQNDEELYVLNTKTLFEVNKSDNNSTPIQEQIDAMFDMPLISLSNATAISTNERTNTQSFVVKHENTLYLYLSDLEKLTQIPSNETPASQNADKIAFDLLPNDTVLLLQEANNVQTLVAISPDSGASTTILTASKVEFYIIDDKFYVNTLELEAGAGWQAHRFVQLNNNFTFKTYDNSRFIFTTNLQEERDDLYLLSSDEAPAEVMIKPSLYKFDSGETNGRRKGKDKNKNTVDFSYGSLNTNVSDVHASIVVNDEYGRITLQGINEDTGVGRAVIEQYYFDPSQEEAASDLDEQSLRLMSRFML